jgi:acetyl-CoA C-acetyltransferase
LGLSPIAAVESQALVAGPDVRLHDQPANAILAALRKLDAGVEELTAAEINEAFADLSVRSVHTLGISPDIVNTRGGAIALGHPLGASGAHIIGTLAR